MRTSNRVGSEPTSITVGGIDLGIRGRNGRPQVGIAGARAYSPTDFVSFPFYGPWGSWYPWYGGGFGWNVGFVSYNPWYFGATRWFYGPYGLWYDPYTYYWPSSYSTREERPREPKVINTMGSLRIKANPASAKVYVDNDLAGVVGDFDGLSDHLKVEGGRHMIEIRADGFQTFKQEIDVKIGKTQTLRASLKKLN